MNDVRVPGPAPRPRRPSWGTGGRSPVYLSWVGGARCAGTARTPRQVAGACEILPGRGKRFQSLAG